MSNCCGALTYIIVSGLLMSGIALIGSLVLILKKETLDRVLPYLVALSAGSLLGGAFFHLLPAALIEITSPRNAFLWVLIGFSIFFVLEQYLHWHHCHKASSECKKPLTYLILLGDGLHNFIGGLAIGSTFLIDIRLGTIAWIAAALHEVPQELGDFGVLVYGGWKKSVALIFNFISGLTFLVGGLFAYFISNVVNVSYLVALAAGNFIYIAASDLVPEINKQEHLNKSFLTLLFFLIGMVMLYLISVYYN